MNNLTSQLKTVNFYDEVIRNCFITYDSLSSNILDLDSRLKNLKLDDPQAVTSVELAEIISDIISCFSQHIALYDKKPISSYALDEKVARLSGLYQCINDIDNRLSGVLFNYSDLVFPQLSDMASTTRSIIEKFGGNVQ